jgi:Spy/CpxP family protein refolding chaperone
MNTKLKALALTALLGTLALPALAASHPAAPPPPPAPADAGTAENLLHHPKALARFLGLSTAQATQLNGFWTTLQAAEQPLRQARPPLCQQLRTDLGVTSPDPATVGKDTLSLVDNKDQIRDAREAFDTSFSAILTPAQLAKYDTLKQLVHLANHPGSDILGDCPEASS